MGEVASLQNCSRRGGCLRFEVERELLAGVVELGNGNLRVGLLCVIGRELFDPNSLLGRWHACTRMFRKSCSGSGDLLLWGAPNFCLSIARSMLREIGGRKRYFQAVGESVVCYVLRKHKKKVK